MRFSDGESIAAWISLSLEEQYTAPLGNLQFVCAPPRERIEQYRSKLLKGDLVTVLINGVSQGGFIIQTATQRIATDTGVVFTIHCHTPLVTPYQGSATAEYSFQTGADAPLLDVLATALAPFGLGQVIGDLRTNVDSITGKARGKKAGAVSLTPLKIKDAQVQEGESAYEFCARHVTRNGACLRMGWDGAVLVTYPDYEQEPSYTLVQDYDGSVTGGDRFLDGVEITDTNEDQFSECTVRGCQIDSVASVQTDKVAATVTAAELNPKRPAYSTPIAATAFKPLNRRDKSSRDEARSRSTAKLAMGLRAKSAFTVTGEVAGFVSRTGRLWQVDTVANVTIPMAQLDEPMWILSRTFIQDHSGGQRTRLVLIPLNALVLGDLPT
jgi:hypothetical protein